MMIGVLDFGKNIKKNPKVFSWNVSGNRYYGRKSSMKKEILTRVRHTTT
jgi:hypothetical protein